MAHVRGHYRSNGSYVRPHTRRSSPSSGRPATASRRVSATVSRPRPVATGPTTSVRGHYRSNGSYVRAHRRRISAPVVAAAGGGGLLILILVLLALSGGAG